MSRRSIAYAVFERSQSFTRSKASIVIPLILTLTVVTLAQTKPRARDLGVPFDGTPGAHNAITDVKGVEVGHTTLIFGSGKLEIGKYRELTTEEVAKLRGRGRAPS